MLQGYVGVFLDYVVGPDTPQQKKVIEKTQLASVLSS